MVSQIMAQTFVVPGTGWQMQTVAQALACPNQERRFKLSSANTTVIPNEMQRDSPDMKHKVSTHTSL